MSTTADVTAEEQPLTPPPEAPAKAEAKPPETVSTPESLAAAGRALAARILDSNAKDKEHLDAVLEAATARNKQPEEKPEVAEEPAAKPRRRKKAETAEEEPEPLTARQAADIAASAAAAAVREARKAEETAKPAAPVPEAIPLILPEDDEDQRQTYEFLIASKPEKWGDLPKRVQEFSQKEKVYREKWETENPGGEWNPNDEDHNDFYEKNQPRVPDKELREAGFQLAVREAKEELRKEVQPELESLRNKETLNTIMPKLAAAVGELDAAIMEGMNPDYVKALESREELQALFARDQDAQKFGKEVANDFRPLAETIVKLENGIPFNPKDKLHQSVQILHHEAEADIMKTPESARLDDQGRSFIRRVEYEAMKPAEKARHWTLGQAELLIVVREQAKNVVKNLYQKAVESHEAYSKSKGSGEEIRRPTPPPKAPEKQRGGGPSIGSGPAIGNGSGRGGQSGKSGAQVFLESLGLH